MASKLVGARPTATIRSSTVKTGYKQWNNKHNPNTTQIRGATTTSAGAAAGAAVGAEA